MRSERGNEARTGVGDVVVEANVAVGGGSAVRANDEAGRSQLRKAAHLQTLKQRSNQRSL